MTAPTTHTRRSLTLDPADWQTLDALAVRLGSNARGGATTGSPSWRALIREIAQGDVVCERIVKIPGPVETSAENA